MPYNGGTQCVQINNKHAHIHFSTEHTRKNIPSLLYDGIIGSVTLIFT